MSADHFPYGAECLVCHSHEINNVFQITQKPQKETDFKIPSNMYYRSIFQCKACSVYLNVHQMLRDDFYISDYNTSTYQNDLLQTYNRIRSLPLEKSDNKHRVLRVEEFIIKHGFTPQKTKILDVGSGLCVFLGELKERGFKCFCVDPDPLLAHHALDNIKVDGAFSGVLENYKPASKFDVITFNKVLEHVMNPVKMLINSKNLLTQKGVIYIELPDGKAAAKAASIADREEFFIEHLTVFTKTSFYKLIQLAGLQCLKMEAIHEPSDKYTLYAFLARKEAVD